MTGRSMSFATLLLLLIGQATGCIKFTEEYNTQSFDAGEASCLSGKRYYFAYPYGTEKSLPIPYYKRTWSEQSTLDVDTTGHELIDFSLADPFVLALPEDIHVGFYFERVNTLFIASDGTIAFGDPGTGNDTLFDAYSSHQISLLPVDARTEGVAVRYAIEDDRVVITYEDVANNTFQCELFFNGEAKYDIAVTYASVGQNTRAGVVGLPDIGRLSLTSGDIEQFLADFFTESNFCESPPQ